MPYAPCQNIHKMWCYILTILTSILMWVLSLLVLKTFFGHNLFFFTIFKIFILFVVYFTKPYANQSTNCDWYICHIIFFVRLVLNVDSIKLVIINVVLTFFYFRCLHNKMSLQEICVILYDLVFFTLSLWKKKSNCVNVVSFISLYDYVHRLHKSTHQMCSGFFFVCRKNNVFFVYTYNQFVMFHQFVIVAVVKCILTGNTLVCVYVGTKRCSRWRTRSVCIAG